MATGQLDRVRRILLIKPSSLGDVVHALPVLAALRETYPNAHIAWLISKSFAGLLRGHPLVDEVIVFDRRRFGRMLQNPVILWEFVRFSLGLRKKRFDLAIDLQGLFRSGFLARVTGARVRVGFADAREFGWLFYNRRVPAGPKESHAVDKNLRLARALGLDVQRPEFPLAIRPEERAAARQKLADARHAMPAAGPDTPGAGGGELDRFIAVLPGARWDTKRWPAAYVGQLIDRLHAAGLPRVVLLGGPDDRTLAEAITAGCQTKPLNLAGTTGLRELAAVLSLADLVICMDSGPMHIAAALGRPMVALFGPTNPRRTGPWSAASRVVARSLPCMPCYARTCPLVHHDCLRGLQVDEVYAAVMATWAAVPEPLPSRDR